jgi:hypothetical protein
VHRTPSVTAAPILIFLAACAHDSRNARPAESPGTRPEPAPAAATPAANATQQQAPPQSVSGNSAPAAEAGSHQGGANVTPPPAAPPAPPGQPASAAPRARPPAQASSTHPVAPPTGPPASTIPPTSPAVTAAATASQPSKAADAPSLDLNGLEQRLRDTRAIGVFTKLSLKNQVDGLLAQFKAFHQGQSRSTLGQLRQQYELLLMRVVSLLQDGDPALASTILASREALWGFLTDPKKFSAI